MVTLMRTSLFTACKIGGISSPGKVIVICGQFMSGDLMKIIQKK